MPPPQHRQIAALPAYVPAAFDDAPPGHRFSMYFEGWIEGSFERPNAPDISPVAPLGASGQKLVEALRARQRMLFAPYAGNGYRSSVKSTAPFVTGLGNEHPTENGFAFLTPYGLPYLAGSGVKGVLRRAAEELALDNDGQQTAAGWTWVDIWWLFGFESATGDGSVWDAAAGFGKAFQGDARQLAALPELHALIRRLAASDPELARFCSPEHEGALLFLEALTAGGSLRQSLQMRGVLDFWDVFPKPAGERMAVEIMTPHFGDYYEGRQPPHEAGKPNPIKFLAVPAGSEFDFHARCDEARLPEGLRSRWRGLLDSAFLHAFEWVGFGAKTSVGYGAMAKPPASAQAAAGASVTQTRSATPAAAADSRQHWPAATLLLNPGTSQISASYQGKATKIGLKMDEAVQQALGAERHAKFKNKRELKNVAVEVEQVGNVIALKRIVGA